MSKRVLVLADDLTGALEVGALFASRGLQALVTLDSKLVPEKLDDTLPVHVLDTETRHLKAQEAFRIVYAIARKARDLGFTYLYKKTDSTLRGNIGSEISALAAAFPDTPLAYFPAYPRLGRTVSDGRLYVDGVPVSETGFSTDSLNPVRESHIPTLLRPQYPGPALLSIRADELNAAKHAAIYILDGTTDEELRSCAREFAASARLRLAAGPAGFVSHFADFAAIPRSAVPRLPVIKSCLVINGSRHEISEAQIRHGAATGWPVLDADAALPRISGWAILRNPPPEPGSGEDFAARLGRHVCGILETASPDGLAVFGGDTVHAILKALGVDRVWPLGEALPGVPVSKIDRRWLPGIRAAKMIELYLISKAGGFGAEDFLPQVRQCFSGR